MMAAVVAMGLFPPVLVAFILPPLPPPTVGLKVSITTRSLVLFVSTDLFFGFSLKMHSRPLTEQREHGIPP